MRNERFINIELMRFFLGKTNNQISDARRRLKPLEEIKRENAGQPEPQEMGVNLIEKQRVETPSESLPQSISEYGSLENESDEWRNRLTQAFELAHELPDMWKDWHNELVAARESMAGADIDQLYDNLVSKLLVEIRNDQPKRVQMRRLSANVLRVPKSVNSLMRNVRN